MMTQMLRGRAGAAAAARSARSNQWAQSPRLRLVAGAVAWQRTPLPSVPPQIYRMRFRARPRRRRRAAASRLAEGAQASRGVPGSACAPTSLSSRQPPPLPLSLLPVATMVVQAAQLASTASGAGRKAALQKDPPTPHTRAPSQLTRPKIGRPRQSELFHWRSFLV